MNALQLADELERLVRDWRDSGYVSDEYPFIGEILDSASGKGISTSPYLRAPQVAALETYWFLRIVRSTESIPSLFESLSDNPAAHLKSLGLDSPAMMTEAINRGGVDKLLDAVRTDESFVKAHKLESLRETLTLSYPSYIFALAMGAGKTALIGAVIATEFAMAQQYPDGPFIHNSLVFAPGKTIIESLRELVAIPYERILPKAAYPAFAATVKFTFTRDGTPDIDVIRGSHFNIVVTNTEKIRLRSEQIRRGDLGAVPLTGDADHLKRDVANRRLQTLAELPSLGIFSDEAHHTYGQSMGEELKKVRLTVDYLAENTEVLCVVNTTGTPYFNRQPLLDVVYWYGLSQGIADGYLKPVSGNIEAYDFRDDLDAYVGHVVRDFLANYGEVELPNGAKAKIAIYFPQTDDLDAALPVVEAALVEAGFSSTDCLVNHSGSPKTDVDAFNRLNDPESPHRVILLVNKGTEGWNCPSLFACALARTLRSSNNFVLQAATRCLRQVPSNPHKAKIYLSRENEAILERQLQETYGESISSIDGESREVLRSTLVVEKEDIAPVLLTRRTVRVARKELDSAQLKIERPNIDRSAMTMQRYEMVSQASTTRVMREVGRAIELSSRSNQTDVFSLAADLAGRYRIKPLSVLSALRLAYPTDDIPLSHLDDLAGQIESQVAKYEIETEEVEVALALIRLEGFDRTETPDGVKRTAEIAYRKEYADRVWRVEDARADFPGTFGFHYTPYNFDSMPERDFLAKVLKALSVAPGDVEDVYFTGALGRDKSDFVFEYRGTDGRWHDYAPDFLIRRRAAPGEAPGSGKLLIIEIKQTRLREDPVDGAEGTKAMAMKEWESLNPDRLRYEMIFTDNSTVANNHVDVVRDFVGEA
ncbi:DEAD/DEAH box helicase family protein [Microbacterium arborescens]|uniref:DEAD/DEAH box helicase family protein n=1 Tax=Microbacterium arborescens TaxID=33883 RepID=UPI002784C562|nr:DEAD/DEAH box helicase family protein [Microbacterium arborescens]MDQ1217460.1 type III restriction enzyme [Microbacterium arborescens]